MQKGFVIELFHEPEEKRYFEDEPLISAVPAHTSVLPASSVMSSPDQIQHDSLPLEDRLMKFYTVKLEAIADRYQAGGLEWIMQDRPELYQSLCQAEKRIDEVWRSALAGGASVGDFEAAVNAWYDLQFEGIRLYRDALPKPEED